MLQCKKHLPLTLAIFGALAYLVCHFWGAVLPADVRPLHENMLRISVLWWSGMNFMSLLLGLVQWAVWGAISGWVLGIISDRVCTHEEK